MLQTSMHAHVEKGTGDKDVALIALLPRPQRDPDGRRCSLRTPIATVPARRARKDSAPSCVHFRVETAGCFHMLKHAGMQEHVPCSFVGVAEVRKKGQEFLGLLEL